VLAQSHGGGRRIYWQVGQKGGRPPEQPRYGRRQRRRRRSSTPRYGWVVTPANYVRMCGNPNRKN